MAEGGQMPFPGRDLEEENKLFEQKLRVCEEYWPRTV
jgi:hypothetical protein